MAEDTIKYVLIDTSYLRKIGFNHPDLQKLLRLSKDGGVKVFIPHIAWEERRTQLLEEACVHVDDLKKAFERVTGQLTRNMVFGGLTSPSLIIWSDAEIKANSTRAMKEFAVENKIEIVSIAPDHAERAWQRYFNAEPPFNPGQKRENRRKDIPDSWIFEAALDLVEKHPGLVALCDDGSLSAALESNNIRVLKDAQQILDEIDKSATSGLEVEAAEGQEVKSEGADKLEVILAGAEKSFKGLDSKIFGYIGYLGSPTKEELFGLLSQAGVSIEMATNVVERLAITGVISDTGNHYLAVDKEAAKLAASSVESEIIELLES